MAQTTKAATSRSLNFSLGADVMNRVKAAGRTTGEDRAKGLGAGISEVAGTVSKGLTDYMTAEKEKAEKREESINAW